ncbi:LPXTG cell wall anchor domain-containing protein [Enterococcus sp. DIV0242_7C1]|uniref:Gram-positive cocci surface proteins LPxTG domain-containing protein n=1 Tax=Candidatus Enterococcus dunnyi TaxID=1834192 RepID=A0A200J0E5_9ENTE|nr:MULTISPECIES: LPXTG cell wall anchor domain-containing protein [unclassified Enterococcus]MBO0470340.1 LPXTG cell wall anchor domain-containing protein [Enterococcus sp. DIV0242_7C1]OUZ30291.1 hypothetical protein A5889_002579 [Enterococcus sp. 9D6_DIV0238]
MRRKLLYPLIVGIVSIIFQASPLFASASQNDPTDVGITFTGTQQSSTTVATSESKMPSDVSGSGKKNFPNTGEKKSQFFGLLGVLLIFLGLFLFKRLRRKI